MASAFSRRFFLKSSFVLGISAFLDQGCSLKNIIKFNQDIHFKNTEFFKKNQWVSAEILGFLSISEVISEFGFKPEDCGVAVQIIISEFNPYSNWGIATRENVNINAFVYSKSQEEIVNYIQDHSDLKLEKYEPVLILHRLITSTERIHFLFRNLLLCHELEHYYLYKGLIKGRVKHFSKDRIEMRIARRLFESKKITAKDLSTLQKIYDMIHQDD